MPDSLKAAKLHSAYSFSARTGAPGWVVSWRVDVAAVTPHLLLSICLVVSLHLRMRLAGPSAAEAGVQNASLEFSTLVLSPSPSALRSPLALLELVPAVVKHCLRSCRSCGSCRSCAPGTGSLAVVKHCLRSYRSCGSCRSCAPGTGPCGRQTLSQISKTFPDLCVAIADAAGGAKAAGAGPTAAAEEDDDQDEEPISLSQVRCWFMSDNVDCFVWRFLGIDSAITICSASLMRKSLYMPSSTQPLDGPLLEH